MLNAHTGGDGAKDDHRRGQWEQRVEESLIRKLSDVSDSAEMQSISELVHRESLGVPQGPIPFLRELTLIACSVRRAAVRQIKQNRWTAGETASTGVGVVDKDGYCATSLRWYRRKESPDSVALSTKPAGHSSHPFGIAALTLLSLS